MLQGEREGNYISLLFNVACSLHYDDCKPGIQWKEISINNLQTETFSHVQNVECKF